MDCKENTIYSSPSLIQKNTPIRRVGLSRKRKSSTPEINANQLQSKIMYKSPSNTTVNSDQLESEDTGEKIDAEEKGCVSMKNNCNGSDVMTVKKRCIENVTKPKLLNETLDSENIYSEIKELENLHEVWKNGCKEALLHLLVLLKDKQPEFNSVEKVSVKLGIWDTIQSAFEKDAEFLSYEE